MSQRPPRQRAAQKPGKAPGKEPVHLHPREGTAAGEILDLLPVSLWVEDFSGVKARLDRYRHAGVANLKEHLDRRPQELLALLEMVRTVWVNGPTLQLFEAADRALFQEQLHRVFDKESYEVFKEHIAALADGRTEFAREAVLTTPRGGRKNIILRAKVDPSCAEDLSRVFFAVTDITLSKAAEEDLRRSEALYRQAFDSAAVPMLMVDPRTEIIIDANRTLQQVLGLPAQSFLGAPIGQICPERGNPSRAEALANLIAGRQSQLDGVRLVRGDRAEVNVAVSARAVQSGTMVCTVLAFSPAGAIAYPWERRMRVDRRASTALREKLSARERMILTLIARGQTNQKIADNLGISRKTVETHRQRLMQKLDIHKATDLVRYALTSGFLGSE